MSTLAKLWNKAASWGNPENDSALQERLSRLGASARLEFNRANSGFVASNPGGVVTAVSLLCAAGINFMIYRDMGVVSGAAIGIGGVMIGAFNALANGINIALNRDFVNHLLEKETAKAGAEEKKVPEAVFQKKVP